MPFSHPVTVRYLEVDQQGVVFNMWYLAYFDDAMTAFLAHRGLPYADMLAAGYDAQVVHTEVDWTGPLRWGEPAIVDVTVGRVGVTSFTLDFRVRIGDRNLVTASTAYVVVRTDGTGKVQIPRLIRTALGHAPHTASGPADTNCNL